MSRVPLQALESRTCAGTGSRDAECARGPHRVLLRIAGRLVRSALTINLALSGEAALAGELTCHQLPMRPIVNGHHVQPRADRLQALGYSDLTSQQAEEVERLYQQLLQTSALSARARGGN